VSYEFGRFGGTGLRKMTGRSLPDLFKKERKAMKKNSTFFALLLLGGLSVSAQGLVMGADSTARQARDAAIERQQEHERDLRACGITAFRIVNGETNNCLLSTNWITLPRKYTQLKVVQELDGMVFCDVEDTGSGRIYESLLLTNYPRANEIVTDHYLTDVRATKIGRRKTNLGTFEIYDCGRPVVLAPH
jgi:hypothetical protein